MNQEQEAKLLRDAKPCPFCHNDDLALVDCDPSRKHAWSVGCPECEAGGPTSRDPREALGLWNEAKR